MLFNMDAHISFPCSLSSLLIQLAYRKRVHWPEDVRFWSPWQLCFSWPVHKLVICFAHPPLRRAEYQALEHGHNIKVTPHPMRSPGREPAGLSPSYCPFPTQTWNTENIHKENIWNEVLYLSQEANFHCATYINARSFGIKRHRNKINWTLPNARIHRPRIVSLPDIIPLRIRWRASTSFIKTEANTE